ncbi:hypothetical protein ABVV53_10040 [Novosphingobium sp. RD2P27]|uniref:Uncharacterized protein n=1 Tax=Novosphingobium kalidii TaxID=3230299 RepID=A0ABV2D2C3_9SPHN
MSGAQVRAMLSSAARLARQLDLASSRGRRLLGQDAPPLLAELHDWPQWLREPEAERQRIFAVTALCASNDALGRVISGDTLRAYADKVSEPLLEEILTHAGPGGAPLPTAEALTTAGQAHARRALPHRLALRLGLQPVHDREAARHVADAETMVRRAPVLEVGR